MSEYTESDLDDKYNEGVDDGYSEGKEDAIKALTRANGFALAGLKKRYEYLRLGGAWQVNAGHTKYDRELYLAGFEDALRAAGVKP